VSQHVGQDFVDHAMISSRRKKAKKPVKPGPTHQKHAGRQPDWDVSTIDSP